MKYLLYIVISFLVFSCQKKNKIKNNFKLSVSPSIEQSNTDNQKIISVLSNFLETKNTSLTENKFWYKPDFEKYNYPYKDIFQIEKSKYGEKHFKPILMEVIPITKNEKLLKIGFVGTNTETKEIVIRAIYNITAIKNNTDWKLKRAIEHQTKDWRQLKRGSITYYLPKRKTPNENEIEAQRKDIEIICDFFNTTPLNILYYSCDSPKQVFEIKGFDYLPNMFFSKNGGMADFGNIIYSGNNSEHYTHEIIHIYTKKLFPKIQPILNEGIATYFGGSGLYNYLWHREKFKTYLSKSSINLSKHLNPYERLYIDNETPIPYMIGALICERTIRLYGKEGLIQLFNSDKEFWQNLNDFGLTPENFTKELKEQIKTTVNNLYKPLNH